MEKDTLWENDATSSDPEEAKLTALNAAASATVTNPAMSSVVAGVSILGFMQGIEQNPEDKPHSDSEGVV